MPSRGTASQRRATKAWMALGVASAALSSNAQSLVSRSESQLDAPEAERQIAAERLDSLLDPTSAAYVRPNSFLTWGPIVARPHLNTRFSYGNSIRSRTGANENTVISEISPGSLFEIGSKWRLDYTPSLTYYSSKDFKDTLNQNVGLTGHTSYENWTFGVSQTYSAANQPLIETGRQTETEDFHTGLSASYYFSSKLKLDLGVQQNIQNADQFSSSRSWSTMDWLNYQISQRISIGAGVGGGYQNVSASPDMSYEQIQARIDSRISQKLTLSINGGAEIRQILGVHADPLVNPIYGASIIYHPFQVTTLSLSGNRVISASLLQSDVTENTDISLALNQRLLGLLYLTVSGGYRNTQYISSNNQLTLNREDNTLSFSANLSYAFVRNGDISVFFNFSDNSSTQPGFAFSSHQIGLQLGYRF